MSTSTSIHLGVGRLSVDGTGLHDPIGPGGYIRARHPDGTLTVHADDLDALVVDLHAMAHAASEAAGRARSERVEVQA